MILVSFKGISFFNIAFQRKYFLFIIIWISLSVLVSKFKMRAVIKGLTYIIFTNLIFYLIFYMFKAYSLVQLPSIRFPFFVFMITIAEIMLYLGKYYALKFKTENVSYSDTSLISKNLTEVIDTDNKWYKIKDAKNKVPFKDYCLDKITYNTPESETIIISLWEKYLDKYQELFDFLNSTLDLLSINKNKSQILDSETFYNIQNQETESLHFFLNLHKINDFRRINQYLIQLNTNLETGGICILNAQTITQRWNYFIKKYSLFFGTGLYFADFIINRVFPKIPVIQGWYFMITKGKNRALSETEIIGRFYFCGFELVNKTEIDQRMFYILRKIKPPLNDQNPSYGPLIKLNRIGKDFKNIRIYKLRTMHPYSEYLQDYVYNVCSLQEGGKFKNDFRVTFWGKIFRKMWIDELPQFWNMLKGDVKFVGVRALSKHYFGLYPKEMQELRVKVKPGLVPPFYVDMPKTFEEILDSEKRYTQSYLKHPIRTDVMYFVKAMWNIFIKHARSN